MEENKIEISNFITNFIKDNTLKTYLTFDDVIEDAHGGTTVSEKGDIAYANGFFGQGAVLDNGYISIADYLPGNSSQSIAMWFKTTGVASDPVLFSNKDWNSGIKNGFVRAV